jgi:cytidine deaminase
LAGSDGSEIDVTPAILAAREAREGAIAPYSRFNVGAALVTRSGRIYRGANIESASYGLTMCAERVALFNALSAGEREFRLIVVATDTARPTPPCGACRQLLWEYCGDVEVLLATLTAVAARHSLRELLPVPFDRAALELES